ncbi:putative PEP-binding protein [Kineothrix sp. MB12-C1]|uniref:putative PEP-binding protein n=1 Tax=Kineothrix sp. MB12-C1 TaxID=3070215 RepID=UPI0027D255FD|nr:putative PEP-binding protein [Kineothrix sp. MB12-C1]WMC92194.1 putative PEP-binding protein [Kineothrix sp. MB12-C1]
MIETPAVDMISDLLAKEEDFFSIGINDLTQYTFAFDRKNAKDMTLTEEFVGMGMNELSATPTFVLPIEKS